MARTFFIERGTDYKFSSGKLSVYETNCPCKGVKFNFNKYVITLMLNGHKTISTTENKVEFFPGTIFIPEKDMVQRVDITNATYTNPTQCLVLEVDPKSLKEFYFDYLKLRDDLKEKLIGQTPTSSSLTRFFSNDTATIESFIRFYKYTKRANTKVDEIVNRNILKELLFRLFETDAKFLLQANMNDEVGDEQVAQVVDYIHVNLTAPISIDDLVSVSNYGKTKLFNQFKQEIGVTPVQYIMAERVKLSEKLIEEEDSLQAVAYQSGFNTYVHFHNSFKRMKGMTPMNYKKQCQLQGNAEVRMKSSV